MGSDGRRLDVQLITTKAERPWNVFSIFDVDMIVLILIFARIHPTKSASHTIKSALQIFPSLTR